MGASWRQQGQALGLFYSEITPICNKTGFLGHCFTQKTQKRPTFNGFIKGSCYNYLHCFASLTSRSWHRTVGICSECRICLSFPSSEIIKAAWHPAFRTQCHKNGYVVLNHSSATCGSNGSPRIFVYRSPQELPFDWGLLMSWTSAIIGFYNVIDL